MEYGQMLGDSFEYVKEGLVGKWMKWILLIVSTIIFPLLYGYLVRVYRAKGPAPELEDWGGLFIDGIKLLVINIIYVIPVFIVALIFGVGGALAGTAMGTPNAAMAGGAMIGLLAVMIVFIIIGLIMPFGWIRFARTESIGEAFNFSAIFEHIGKVGWVEYIIALLILFVVLSVIQFVLGIIPVLGWLLMFILAPAFAIFSARYITIIYDSVPA
ncbi:hypothetical protein RJ53_01155 [Methanocalculus chunghsingensis]|uniref:DUF4013 domain-containing protein n=1 Tax=Methanocalculus chunghsingensis TaxID=156457 RepID=A0A8J8B615_9EURY|nr:DUF4013 domain-containing protein [Methanocalculus chunghsingensis]MBR1368172.1 hypothetical protein [Methanocalculus chunghsingensis]